MQLQFVLCSISTQFISLTANSTWMQINGESPCVLMVCDSCSVGRARAAHNIDDQSSYNRSAGIMQRHRWSMRASDASTNTHQISIFRHNLWFVLVSNLLHYFDRFFFSPHNCQLRSVKENKSAQLLKLFIPIKVIESINRFGNALIALSILVSYLQIPILEPAISP